MQPDFSAMTFFCRRDGNCTRQFVGRKLVHLAKSLQAQEVSLDGRAQKMAALADVRIQISKLQAQLNREARIASGAGGMSFAVANLSGES